jgi:hypothetical protein
LRGGNVTRREMTGLFLRVPGSPIDFTLLPFPFAPR